MHSAPGSPDDPSHLRAIIEALVFAAVEPLTVADLRDLFPDVSEEDLVGAIDKLSRDYDSAGRGLQMQRIAGGYRLATRPNLGEWIRALFRSRNRRRLSAAALETLAIVAYRQPITTPEIQTLRGTDPAGVLQTLLDKKLLRVVGRKKVVGKPLLYATTREFLTHFGLNSLEDLPSLEEFGDMAAALGESMAAPQEIAREEVPITAAPCQDPDEGNSSGGSDPFEDEADDGEDARQDEGKDA